MVLWMITVIDVETQAGVPKAEVYLFSGSGGIEPPENADYKMTANGNGIAVFDVPQTLYRVGIIAKGYETAPTQPQHTPSEEWKDTWTSWGTGGAGYDYPFEVKKIPGYEPPEQKPSKLIIVGGVAAAAFTIISSILLIRKKKK